MIREFTEGIRILFFPTRWANAVARWIAGVHSKTGTVQITNTLSPGADGSVSIDVDVSAVSNKVRTELGFDRESPVNHSEVRNIVFDLVDGASIINSGRRISINQEWLAQQVSSSGSSSITLSSDTPQAVGSQAATGSGSAAARADHVHALNTDGTLAFDTSGNLGAVFGTTSGTVAKGDHNHDTAYASKATETTASEAAADAADALSAAQAAASAASAASAAVANKADANHTHAYGDSTLTGFKASATKDFDTTGGTMAYDSKIKTLANALSSEGKVKTSSLTCDVSDHSNNCLLVASGTTVTHSGNAMYNMLNAATEQTTKQATKIITDKDAPYIPDADSGKVAVTGTGGMLEASADTFAKFASTPSGSKFVKTSGTDGTLAEDDFEGLEDSSSNIQDVGTTTALGTSKKAAPSNHVHALPTMNGWTGDQTLTNMIQWDTSHASSDGYVTMKFYPPIFDKYGRYKGLSTTAITQDLLVPWD